MLQIFHLCVLNLSLVLGNFCRNFFLEMCKKHILFLDRHNRFDKSQYDKKVSSCAFKGFVFRFESMLELRRIIFENPSTSDWNKLLMRVVSASFKLLFSSWSCKFRHGFLGTLFAHFIIIWNEMNTLNFNFIISLCGILLIWFYLKRLL